MRAKEPVILPEKYYLDYFNYLIEFVCTHYDHVLDAPEYLFIQDFNNLSEDAKCLYLRFSNRRGDFFRFSKVQYAEIQDKESAKNELLHHAFIDINHSLDTLQLKLFTKSELVNIFEFLDRKSTKATILSELSEEDVPLLFDQEEIIEVQKNQEVAFLKLLFFGNRYHQMTEFVIRDVGHVKLQPLDASKFKPWFQSRAEALGVMHISQLKGMIKEIIETGLPLEDYLNEMPWNQWMQHEQTKSAAEKLLLKVADHFEKAGLLDLALHYYALTSMAPARERSIRILEKSDRKEEAVLLARSILDRPANATELTFATDFLNKSGIRISRSMTKRLQQAPSISLEDTGERVENQVLDYFIQQGWTGLHSENFLWRALFGLTFWDELFNQDQGSFHHPLQRQPSDLHKPEFFLDRAPQLRQRVKSLRTRKQFLTHISQVHQANEGVANRFVYWAEELMDYLEIMVEKLPLTALKKVMLEIAKQTKENSTGFPDLFIWNASGYHFYEVKSPNDHLSAQQLFWLDYLSSSGIKCEIMRVNYLKPNANV